VGAKSLPQQACGGQEHHGQGVCRAAADLHQHSCLFLSLHQGMESLMLLVRALQAQDCESLTRVVQEPTAFCSKPVAGMSIMAERIQSCSRRVSAIFSISFHCMKTWNPDAISACFAGPRM